MKFSIVTPSLNQGRFIRDCIESVRVQTEVDWEHIIVDAGSTDNTLDVLREYHHLQWTSEPDKGMSDGINKGFLRATGDWLMWLNADDYLLPGALAKVAAFVAQRPNADVVYGGWQFVDADKALKKTIRVFPFDLKMLIHYGCYIGSTACFLRRASVVEQGHFLDTEFRYVMDAEYYARLGKLKKIFLPMPEVLAAFRLHESNTSMVHARKKDKKSILARERQLAESAAVRRTYGWTPFRNPMANHVADAFLWSFYRMKKPLLKLLHGCY